MCWCVDCHAGTHSLQMICHSHDMLCACLFRNMAMRYSAPSSSITNSSIRCSGFRPKSSHCSGRCNCRSCAANAMLRCQMERCSMPTQVLEIILDASPAASAG